MEQEIDKRAFHSNYEWRRCTLIWVSAVFWAVFLTYMLLFHYFRESFEPIVMRHFSIGRTDDYPFIEMLLFLYLLWSCCIVSILSIVSGWGKHRRPADKRSDKCFMITMLITVCFAFYYANSDLDCIGEHITILEHIFCL